MESEATSNEAACVDEDATVDARHLRKGIVPHTSPLLREGLPAFETVGRDGDGLDAPVASHLIWVDHIEGLLSLGNRYLFLEIEEVLL